ncbi:hypothetical protein HaLaN_14172 [Haematococcus lacustris]|uniref:Uncharacterized protein n=1 Tax=Haematococcus lacustris TaxID=44745 RepID=A0A699Z4F5_HAELA|nr:hypothetical protein HaLaN_14172 [Haematococcus lacustris]
MAYTWHTHGHGRLPPTLLPDHEGYDVDSNGGAHTIVPQRAGSWVACLAPACTPSLGTPCPWHSYNLVPAFVPAFYRPCPIGLKI